MHKEVFLEIATLDNETLEILKFLMFHYLFQKKMKAILKV